MPYNRSVNRQVLFEKYFSFKQVSVKDDNISRDAILDLNNVVLGIKFEDLMEKLSSK